MGAAGAQQRQKARHHDVVAEALFAADQNAAPARIGVAAPRQMFSSRAPVAHALVFQPGFEAHEPVA